MLSGNQLFTGWQLVASELANSRQLVASDLETSFQLVSKPIAKIVATTHAN